MDPMISNFLASCIVKWLRSSVNDDAPPGVNLEELIDYTTKLLNLAEHAPTAVAQNVKIPKLDKEIKTVLWTVLCEIFLHEDSGIEVSIREPDCSTLCGMLGRSDIARKVFVHYLIDRVQERDLGTLNRCLPLIIQTWPQPDFDEGGIIYRQTYISFIRTIMDIIVKRNLYELIADLKWRQVIMDNFLLKVIAWDEKIHEQMIMLLSSYFVDSKLLLKLGPQIIIVSDWADITATHGKSNEKASNKMLKEIEREREV
ncbi:hypothetical protein CU098_005960 [Rhizopus stolonifer]|uniref:Uncharacterized protein n=1 Tax=Rhizopus stolonifer TaxID=4846 RepID=A0A367IMY3_RHIST|nr:hypothetical protein CU098_005960 [Rhizopus stolonifer]